MVKFVPDAIMDSRTLKDQEQPLSWWADSARAESVLLASKLRTWLPGLAMTGLGSLLIQGAGIRALESHLTVFQIAALLTVPLAPHLDLEVASDPTKSSLANPNPNPKHPSRTPLSLPH